MERAASQERRLDDDVVETDCVVEMGGDGVQVG